MTIDWHYRRERLRRGWLDLFEDAGAGVWGLHWAPDFAEPDWPGTRTRRTTTICPATIRTRPTPKRSSMGAEALRATVADCSLG